MSANEKVYIHEFIDIIKHNRANYVHHMTANYSPIAQEERGQLCFGVWGVVGSTGRWPQVVNIWEERSYAGMAASFRHEFEHPTLQDPKLSKWWARAAEYRSGGFDRLLVPAPWMRTIEQLTAAGVRGEVFAHTQIQLRPGGAPRYLELIRERAADLSGEFSWELAGAWRTAMVDDSECILLWTIPTWEKWAAFEQALVSRPELGRVSDRDVEVLQAHRFLMVDAPLSPFRTGRQPARSDRVDDYEET